MKIRKWLKDDENDQQKNLKRRLSLGLAKTKLLLLATCSMLNLDSATPLTPTRIQTPWAMPIAVDYQPISQRLILSANQESLDPIKPHFIGSIDATGNAQVILGNSGFTDEVDEVELAVVRSSNAGFTAGDIFCSTGIPGEIARISANGTQIQTKWAVLKDQNGIQETGQLRGGLHVDRPESSSTNS